MIVTVPSKSKGTCTYFITTKRQVSEITLVRGWNDLVWGWNDKDRQDHDPE